ncbi:MAG: hypothetical protein KJZ87_22540, partial [Thermoguttaceae bacterium]|nr:hypothetical protein [Thermoguttaceae bacterium]
LVDCHLYRQQNRLILHLVNLTSAETWRAPVDELIPVAPLRVEVRIAEGQRANKIKFLVSQRETSLVVENGAAVFHVPSLVDHEVVVLEI